MNYLEFKKKMFDLACFNTNQVYMWQPDFDRNNITRWLQKKYLIRLRQGYYSFPEYIGKPDFAYYIGNRIYQPSYISLHAALSFYGIIPEAVVQITSVTTLKTAIFKNEFAEYSYNTINGQLFFGFDIKPMADGRILQIAKPEKALLDLLYLYSFYDTVQELLELRLDEDYMQEELDLELLKDFTEKFNNKALKKRVNLLIKVYGL